MERAGIVRRSTSCWASPLHILQKADGTWRPCGDYRRLNVQTQPDLYRAPTWRTFRTPGRMQILFEARPQKGIFSGPGPPGWYLQDSHHHTVRHIWVCPHAIRPAECWTDFSMADGPGAAWTGLLFRIPGWHTVLIASPTLQQHEEHLCAVLARLEAAGLVLNRSKCVFTA
jgi:hypothetical protein